MMNSSALTSATEEQTVLAVPALELLLLQTPLNVELHQLLFNKKHALGDELGALAHLIAVNAINAFHISGSLTNSKDAENPAWQLFMVATGYFMKGDYAIAECWYQTVLLLDENLAAVYQNLVEIHLHFGRPYEAEVCRTRAYQLQRIFIDPVLQPLRQLLILCVGRTKGNIPYELLLSAETSQRIKYIIDYADAAEDAQLPPYDLVFNAIGEPDVAAPLLPRMQRFMQQCRRQVLNAPEVVARTQRHDLPELMRGLEQVVVAPCIRLEARIYPAIQLQQQLSLSQLLFPVLVRPVESHGGQGLLLCDDIEQLQQHLLLGNAEHYVSSFIDFRSADGYYRKYRVIFIDKQPYAYHLAISPHWMVHYYSADMEAHQWKIAEEARFLQHTADVVGASGWATLLLIGQRLNLEYAGIDFTLLPNGDLFLFEANATMLVHRVRQDGVLAHKNFYVQKIADAFEMMLVAKMATATDPKN